MKLIHGWKLLGLGLCFGLPSAVAAAATEPAGCIFDAPQGKSCSYTAEREGVHQIRVTLAAPGTVTIAGQPCGGKTQPAAAGPGFQAICYAYFNNGAGYRIAASSSPTVSISPAEPPKGEVVLIP
ncbi:hypothetical protein [Niveispirillum sp. BGYR6]|uniref:hypothetical protein n=1 Tax=Niveispirillum sp. BGYR6 TaxID=2971249 RepID=UPI0022B9D342|nr:hypothetical protein [Niveispirillum sp. BGYR6]MDG5495808.1 hypothetical protein [Niveispirillum sp. BGYR6]